ncbi:hypothetical protein F5X97DRAFT_306902 [Nemania serpens]|nr:hypothetical protein F5X97DRAFT_306902 [Nemania serpens]
MRCRPIGIISPLILSINRAVAIHSHDTWCGSAREVHTCTEYLKYLALEVSGIVGQVGSNFRFEVALMHLRVLDVRYWINLMW